MSHPGMILDSDAGNEDDSQWNVTIQGDTMHWQGYGSDWALEFEIIQVRIKNKEPDLLQVY